MTDKPKQADVLIQPAIIRWRDNGTPESAEYNDVYFSQQDGLAESNYVFLEHNNLATRWKSLPADTPGVFVVAETGFGTGLNFLAAWQLWQATAPRNWQLRFLSFEKHPLVRSDLIQASRNWPELAPLSEKLVAAYPALVPGLHCIDFTCTNVSLHLFFGEALQAMQQWLPQEWEPAVGVDAWFLDGFAPARNPGMWSEELFAQLQRQSKCGTTFATFTAVGDVRRSLKRAGFHVEKVPGFGTKREMLRGEISSGAASKRENLSHHESYPAWAQLPPTNPAVKNPSAGKTALVIGGGLAGTSSAFALAARGWQVTLLEKNAALAQGASGNTQGVLYTKLSHHFDQHALFCSLSFQYALRYYSQLFRLGRLQTAVDGELCGVLQLAFNDKEALRQAQIANAYRYDRDFCQPVNPAQASELAATPLQFSGLFYPQAGWLNPQNLCNYWASHPNITQQFHSEVAELHREQGLWHALDADGACLARASTVIVANAEAAKRFAALSYLPCQSIRGQISEWSFPGGAAVPRLQCVVCHEGYVTPALNQVQRLGATFNLHNQANALSLDDHLENWSKLHKYLPDIARQLPLPSEPGKPGTGADSIRLGGRVAFRCTSADYLPMVGPVPDLQRFLDDYAALRKDARQHIDTPGVYLPGLYVNIAHASRGLSSTPICAALLAAQINAEPLPLGISNCTALNPARFIIRDLIRNRR